MANIKNPENPNPRGQVALGAVYVEVKKIAEQEMRSIPDQIAVIVREWKEYRKKSKQGQRTVQSAS